MLPDIASQIVVFGGEMLIIGYSKLIILFSQGKTEEEKERLIALLTENYRPENRVYRYNFFYDNCATRPRDQIVVFGGEMLIIGYSKLIIRFSQGKTEDEVRGVEVEHAVIEDGVNATCIVLVPYGSVSE